MTRHTGRRTTMKTRSPDVGARLAGPLVYSAPQTGHGGAHPRVPGRY
jgi:hypothetical protein